MGASEIQELLRAGDSFAVVEREFLRAQEVLPAGDPAAEVMEPCNLGYLAVARLCMDAGDGEASARFEEITALLRARGDEYARVYQAQLLAARRLFAAGHS